MTQVIVALDVDTIARLDELIAQLHGTITHYKIGLQLFTAHGKRAIDIVHKAGGKVFLDLKFLDIPQTVANAVKEAGKLGVESCSIHLSGGAEMVKAAVDVSGRPKLWGVTVLTSMQAKDIKFLHPQARVPTMVRALAHMGWIQGVDATICSGHEVEYLRRTLKNLDMKFVTPGIRPAGGNAHDQKRTLTPGEAAKLHIDYAVIGRPITHAENPLKAAQDIMAEMKAASSKALEAP